MSAEQTTQPTLLPVVSIPLNCWITSCGGMVLIGLHARAPIGHSSQPYLVWNLPMRYDQLVIATEQSTSATPIIPFNRYSTYNLKRVTAWIFRFIQNCRNPEIHKEAPTYLTTEELFKADNYWISHSQWDHFPLGIKSLNHNSTSPEGRALFTLHLGGRIQHAGISYSSKLSYMGNSQGS